MERRTEEKLNILAKWMKLRFPEQWVAIFADPVQSEEDGFVEDTFAFDVEEGAPLGKGVMPREGHDHWNQNKYECQWEEEIFGTHLEDTQKKK